MKKDPMDVFEGLKDYPGKRPPINRNTTPPRVVPNEPDRWDSHPVLFTVAGRTEEFFLIGAVCRAIGRKGVTIRKWESQGYMPRAQYRTPKPQGEQVPGKTTKGRRLYSRRQVELLIKAVVQYLDKPRGDADWIGFRTYVRSNWKLD